MCRGNSRFVFLGVLVSALAAISTISPAGAGARSPGTAAAASSGPLDGSGTWDSGPTWWSSSETTAWSDGGSTIFGEQGAGNGSAGTVFMGDIRFLPTA